MVNVFAVIVNLMNPLLLLFLKIGLLKMTFLVKERFLGIMQDA